MFGLIKRQEEDPRRDLMIVLQEDGAADIATVTEIDDERILARGAEGEYAIPLGDAKRYIGQHGKVFVYPSTIENISDTKRIARLEVSRVLQQITHFEKEAQNVESAKLPLGRLLLIGGIVLLVIIVLAVAK